MGLRRAGRGLKRFLETVRFILAEFEPKPSHGDPIWGQSNGLGRTTCVGIWYHGAMDLRAQIIDMGAQNHVVGNPHLRFEYPNLRCWQFGRPYYCFGDLNLRFGRTHLGLGNLDAQIVDLST